MGGKGGIGGDGGGDGGGEGIGGNQGGAKPLDSLESCNCLELPWAAVPSAEGKGSKGGKGLRGGNGANGGHVGGGAAGGDGRAALTLQLCTPGCVHMTLRPLSSILRIMSNKSPSL